VLERQNSPMLSFLGNPSPCLCIIPPLLTRPSGLQSVFHAAMLGDISLIQLWTNGGERIRIDEKHPVTGASASIPAPARLQRVMLPSGGTMLHYAAANRHEDCVAWLIKRGCKVLPNPRARFLDVILHADYLP
jgi:hypothetical protein